METVAMVMGSVGRGGVVCTRKIVVAMTVVVVVVLVKVVRCVYEVSMVIVVQMSVGLCKRTLWVRWK